MLIETKWTIVDRSKIHLFSMNTPNGIKAAVALEELGLAYEPHLVNITKGEQKSDAFLSISPNGKIPAIVDFQVSGAEPLTLMESGAILIYLAEKAGRLIPHHLTQRLHCLQWLFFQVGHVGPFFGQFGHFYKYARDKVKEPYPLEHFTEEAKRLLSVLDRQLAGREYLVDDYSIADIATFPWVNALIEHYEASDVLGLPRFGNVTAWLERCNARPAARKGKLVNSPH